MCNKKFLKNGSGYISERIAAAVADESRTAIISGCYEIDEAVRLPSDFTLVLENCHLRMADGCYSNMFVNESHGKGGIDKNIKIIGRGEAILDGGKYNGLSERNHSRDGLPHIRKNNLLLFTGVDGFEVRDIHCRNQRWWALDFVYCSNGYIGNVDFRASDIAVGADGVEYHGLKRERYDEVLVKNADGIDLRCGCHDIVIENITGFTEDDTIALTALPGSFEEQFRPEGACRDIYNVRISGVRSSAFCTNVRLLNQGGVRLHDIVIEDVYDESLGSPYMDHGLYAVRVGDTRLYGACHSTAEETYNITIRRVRGRGEYAVSLAGSITNLSMSDIEAFGDAKPLLDERI